MALHPHILAITSTTQHGDMDYRFSAPDIVTDNRRRFLTSCGVAFENAVGMQSLHDDTVVVLEGTSYPSPTSATESVVADALITKTVNQPLLLTTADCIPLTIYDESGHTIALVHVSRHTFLKGLIQKTVAVYVSVATVPIHQVRAILGPHIHPESYRFPLPLKDRPRALEPFITEQDSFAYIDLARATHSALKDSGVKEEHILTSPIDTATSTEHFSHVRSVTTNTPEGRLLTVAALLTT